MPMDILLEDDPDRVDESTEVKVVLLRKNVEEDTRTQTINIIQ
jgi:hypothetical protein